MRYRTARSPLANNYLREKFLVLLTSAERRLGVACTASQFDRALRSLPITQHGRIWQPYVAFVRAAGVPEAATRIYRRFLKVCWRQHFVCAPRGPVVV